MSRLGSVIIARHRAVLGRVSGDLKAERSVPRREQRWVRERDPRTGAIEPHTLPGPAALALALSRRPMPENLLRQ